MGGGIARVWVGFGVKGPHIHMKIYRDLGPYDTCPRPAWGTRQATTSAPLATVDCSVSALVLTHSACHNMKL